MTLTLPTSPDLTTMAFQHNEREEDQKLELTGEDAKANLLSWFRTKIKKRIRDVLQESRQGAATSRPQLPIKHPKAGLKRLKNRASLSLVSNKKKWMEGAIGRRNHSPLLNTGSSPEGSIDTGEGELSEEEEVVILNIQVKLFPQE